jgi:hypothetical protein
MKITKRQLRSIIRESLMEGYNSMSSASKSHANAMKRKFMKLYPDAKVGIDGREGWVTVNDKKAINMSQASGSPLTDEEMIDKMHAVYAGESVDSDVPTATSSNDTYSMNERMQTDVYKIVQRVISQQGAMTHQELLANVLSDFPNTSDEEIDGYIDGFEEDGSIIYDSSSDTYH